MFLYETLHFLNVLLYYFVFPKLLNIAKNIVIGITASKMMF